MNDTVDVLIVGAGISGVGMACHLHREQPGTSYTILERRDDLGGTWDLFRYPGIRSDSDMVTFGFGFRPWTDTKVLADGASIKGYVGQTADEYGVREHIRFGQQVLNCSWDSNTQRWSVLTRDTHSGAEQTWTARFLVGATGYYNYDAGYRPEFAGEDRFAGPVVHPQQWPEDLDYAGKKVVIIGSGATAVTLVPAMAEDAASITMLQRSPTYMLSVPADDAIAAATTPGAARPARLSGHPRPEHPAATGPLLPGPRPSRPGQEGPARRGPPSARPRHRHGRLHPALRPVGPAVVRDPRR